MSDTLICDDWVENELATVDIGDKRLKGRFGKVLAALAKHTNVSISAACCGHTEMAAAYHFLKTTSPTGRLIGRFAPRWSLPYAMGCAPVGQISVL
jgi:hypothetical protein